MYSKQYVLQKKSCPLKLSINYQLLALSIKFFQ